MSTKYNPNIHKRRSIRLQDYDYSQAGLYFITICVKDGECLFGNIIDGKMILSNVGVVADVLWHQMPHHAPNVKLGEFVVMPNHIHGIIELTEMSNVPASAVGALHATPLLHTMTPHNEKNEYMSSISPKANTLSAIIRSYKSAVSKHAHRLEFNFSWQRSYYENIIRNSNVHGNIIDYIQNNPTLWDTDKFYIN